MRRPKLLIGVAAVTLTALGVVGVTNLTASPTSSDVITAAPAVHSAAYNGWNNYHPATTTTTTTPPTTTAPRPPKPRVSRSNSAGRPATPATGDDFWRRLSNCESPDGRSGTYVGYFQFSHSNAARYGISGSSSYEQQKAAAQDLASHSNPRQQWPVCWRRAGGG